MILISENTLITLAISHNNTNNINISWPHFMKNICQCSHFEMITSPIFLVSHNISSPASYFWIGPWTTHARGQHGGDPWFTRRQKRQNKHVYSICGPGIYTVSGNDYNKPLSKEKNRYLIWHQWRWKRQTLKCTWVIPELVDNLGTNIFGKIGPFAW